jgi:hypothetical protein
MYKKILANVKVFERQRQRQQTDITVAVALFEKVELKSNKNRCCLEQETILLINKTIA